MQRNISFWISALATAAVVLFIVFYAVYRSQSLIKGPIIQVSSPQNGATVTLKDGQPLFIEGEIRNANTVSLNDRKIFLDEHGHFGEQLLLSKGYAIITVKAGDRYGRTATQKLELIIK